MRNYKVSYESVSRAFPGDAEHPSPDKRMGRRDCEAGWLGGSQKLLKHKCLVALARYVPNTQSLTAPFLSELIDSAA
jgi:hypothetical protein